MQAFVAALGQRRKSGLALFDVILAVGVIGILIAGGVLLLQAAQERIKRNDTLALINQIRAESQRIYAGRPTYTGVSMQLLCNRGSLPDDALRSTAVDKCFANTAAHYQHPYDGNVTIHEVSGSKQFVLAVADLDKGPCGDMLSAWAGKSRTRAGIRAASVAGANTVTAAATPTLPWPSNNVQHGGAGYASPFSDANVTTMCAGGDNGNDIYILFQG